MRKMLKLLLISGAAVMLLGAGMTAGAAIGGADLRDFAESRRHDHLVSGGRPLEVEAKEGPQRVELPRKLEISAGEGYVTLSPSPELSDELEVSVPDSAEIRYEIFKDGDTLRLEFSREKPEFHWEMEDRDGDGLLAEVRIPENYRFQELRAEIYAGAGYFSGVCSDWLELSADAGKLAVQDADAGALSLDVSMGDLVLSGNVSQKVQAACSKGNITLHLDGREADFNYVLTGRAGEISLDGREYSGLVTSETVDYQAGKQMELSCSMGSVEVGFAD